MQTIYDITNDKILEAPRVLEAIVGIILCVLFLIFLVSERKNFTKKSNFVSLLSLLLLITTFQIISFTSEWMEYKNNYYLNEYLSGNVEIVEGCAVFCDVQNEGKVSFFVDDVRFDIISNGYNNRGYHLEDYNNSFGDNDYIKVYYKKKQEQTYHNYSDNVIVRIEKQTKINGD